MSLMAEIYEQGCEARNRVREIKKMRQYFQREGREGHVQGQPLGQAAVRDREHVKKWVKEQQKTEPCFSFIYRQLGHWSQECPYQKRAPVHATNVTFKQDVTNESDWSCLQSCAQPDACYKGRLKNLKLYPNLYLHVCWDGLSGETAAIMFQDLWFSRVMDSHLLVAAGSVAAGWTLRGVLVQPTPPLPTPCACTCQCISAEHPWVFRLLGWLGSLCW